MLHPMDRLPLDVWSHILSYACTDGGRTGAALASTSSGIRTASASHRFYSLKLTSLAQIGWLLLCLELIGRAESPRLRTADQGSLNVRHLLLSFFPEDCDSLSRPWREWGEYSSDHRKREEQIAEDESAWRAAKGAWDRQFTFLAPRLFDLVAPSLGTLVVLQDPNNPLPYVSVKLLALRELALLADDGIFVRPAPRWMNRRTDYDHRDIPPFPLLTHLHIVFEGDKRQWWAKTLPLWAELAPAMTHLRVSQARNLIPKVPDAMSTSSFPHANSRPEFEATSVHPRLQKIIIQPERVRGFDHLEERHVLSSAQDEGRSRIVVLRGRLYRPGYYGDRLGWDWQDRMIGKAGCWGECEDDEGVWVHEHRKRAEVSAQGASIARAQKSSARQIKELIRLDKREGLLRTLSGGLLGRRAKLFHERAASL
ncbi:hypothetical protein OH77DRAFT_253726 [Trametes cingulata]|nr:hypothetical protein OH77DRAFT_253726 [Trametes cingulata]